MKRQLKSSLKPIRIVFIGEPAFNAGDPLREFFGLYFDAVARNIMRGTSSSFTLLHDVKKLNNGDFERFGLLIALAIIYGCPGPRNMQESLLCSFLDLPIDDGNIRDIPDFDIHTKLQGLPDTFQNVLNEFPERYTMCVATAFLHWSADKDTVFKNINHSTLLHNIIFGRNKKRPKRNVNSWCEYSVIFSGSQFFTFLSRFEP